jgi:hypothetical protein
VIGFIFELASMFISALISLTLMFARLAIWLIVEMFRLCVGLAHAIGRSIR